MTRRLPLASVLALALAACTEQTAPTAASGALAKKAVAPPGAGVVMSGLDSPRGLAFGPEGALYVAEAGTAAIDGPCVTIARGQNCYSGTGAVSRLWKGEQTRVASGLPSVYNPATTDVTGPHDVGFQGRGNMYVPIGWGANPALRSALGAAGAAFGSLLRVTPNGAWRVAADVSAIEGALNPAGGPLDSNPFGVLVEAGHQIVTDAGGNSLVQVGDGPGTVLATFAPIPVAPGPFNPPFAQSEPVPTRVNRGPDGALYVSELTGVPFVPGAAGIYRVVPGAAPQLYAGGFTTITDFAFAADGTMYVVQYASAPFLGGPGSVVRVAAGNGARSVLLGGLSAPTGVTVGPDGAVYVSNRGNVPGAGEVLRIEP